MNPFGNKRYNSYSSYFSGIFGGRVQKLTIDAGFTCPNRDGTKGKGGCTYCNNEAFNPSYCMPEKSISTQIAQGIEFHKKRYRRAKNYLAYFQSYSNTYAPIEHLKSLFNEALNYPGVVGLVIGTRPDCIDDEKLEYFSALAKQKYIIIEYGIESCYDSTLELINRGHTFDETKKAIIKTSQYGIHTGSHLIFGLPGESREQMFDQVDILSSLPLNTVKFHQLQIISGTKMAYDYKKDPSQFNLFTKDEYVDFIIRFIERLNPSIVIERFTSEAHPRLQVGPTFGNIRSSKMQIIIEDEMQKRDTWQGKFLKIPD
ncbi:MAG: TIGR01212 family radical SAM protein [Deltaproteobacteria bacterium]